VLIVDLLFNITANYAWRPLQPSCRSYTPTDPPLGSPPPALLTRLTEARRPVVPKQVLHLAAHPPVVQLKRLTVHVHPRLRIQRIQRVARAEPKTRETERHGAVRPAVRPALHIQQLRVARALLAHALGEVLPPGVPARGTRRVQLVRGEGRGVST